MEAIKRYHSDKVRSAGGMVECCQLSTGMLGPVRVGVFGCVWMKMAVEYCAGSRVKKVW